MSTYTKAEAETRRARSRWAAPASLTARTSHHKIENLYGYLSATKRLLNGIEATAMATARGTMPRHTLPVDGRGAS